MGNDSRKRPPNDTRTTPVVLAFAPRATSAGDVPLDRIAALTTLAAAINELTQETAAASEDAPRARVSSLAALASEKATTPARAFRLRRRDDEATAEVPPPVALHPPEPDE